MGEHPYFPLNREATRGLGDEQNVRWQGNWMAVGHYKYVLASAHQKLGGKWDYTCICKHVFLESCLGTVWAPFGHLLEWDAKLM